jgi:hypothetical protein
MLITGLVKSRRVTFRVIEYVLSKAEDFGSAAIIPCGFEPLRVNTGFKQLFLF